MTDVEHPVPAPGEDIHLPGPSLKPFLVGAGITLSVIGITIFPPYVFIVGIVLFVVTTYKWIQDVRHDIAALPDEHEQHH
jgi:sterol desaturase/sphingolipid hydroxylase (fatty acid hydroxylase superfamily)